MKILLGLSSVTWIVSFGLLACVQGQDGLRGMPSSSTDQQVVEIQKEHRDLAGESLYKILMLGNSYTWQNNMGAQLQLLLRSRAGISQQSSVTDLHNGGLKLYDILEKTNSPGTAWYLNTQPNNDYDYVILQDQSIVPTMHGNADYYERSKAAAVDLDKKAKAMGADTMMYMTWGRRYGLADGWGNDSFLSMQSNLQVGYEDYANEIKRRNGGQPYMGPVGLAFKYLHDTDYELFKTLYTGDNSHPSSRGTYVGACVFFSTITGQRCEGSPTSYGFDAALLRKLQKAADYASLDARLSRYPLPTPKPPTHTTPATTTQASVVTTTTTPGTISVSPDGYIGCYKDTSDRAMELWASRSSSTAQCLETCASEGYPFAAMQYAKHCFCGTSFDKYGEDPNGCNDRCSVSPDESNMMCGDSWRNSVYSTSGSAPTTSTTTTTTTTTSTTTTTTTTTTSTTSTTSTSSSIATGEPSYIGCYKDARDRAMELWALRSTTTAQCLETCASEGYLYAAMQYAKECFCGNSYDKYGEDPDGCNDRCSVSPDESDMMCGDSWRNSVYSTGVGGTPSTSQAPTSTTTTSTTTSSTTSSTTAGACVNFVLDLKTDDYPSETIWEITKNGQAVASGGPYNNGDSDYFEELCLDDGSYTFTLYDDADDGICCGWGEGDYSLIVEGVTIVDGQGVFESSETTSFTIGEVDGYIGCYKDTSDRAMEHYGSGRTSTHDCLRYCATEGYPFAAMQYSRQCFCGTSYDKYGEDPDGCNDPCIVSPDESDMTCGDSWRNSVYSTAGVLV